MTNAEVEGIANRAIEILHTRSVRPPTDRAVLVAALGLLGELVQRLPEPPATVTIAPGPGLSSDARESLLGELRMNFEEVARAYARRPEVIRDWLTVFDQAASMLAR